MIDKIKGFKTILFNVAIAVAGVLAGQEVVDALIALGLSSDQALEAILGFIAAANVALRAVTNTSVFKKE